VRLNVTNGQKGNTGGKQVNIKNNSNRESNQKYQTKENNLGSYKEELHTLKNTNNTNPGHKATSTAGFNSCF